MNYDRVWKYGLYALSLLLLVLVQNTVMLRLSLFGVHPNLYPLFVATVAVLEGGVAGGVFGALAGLCADTAGASLGVFFGLCFLGLGLGIGLLSDYLFKKVFWSTLLWAFIAHTLGNILYFLFFFIIPGRAGLPDFAAVALPEIAASLLFLPLIWFPLNANHHHWAPEPEVEE